MYKIHIRLSHKRLPLKQQVPPRSIILFLYFSILLIGRFPKSSIPYLRLHTFNLLLYLSILLLPLSFLLLPHPITLPKLPLKTIIPRIIPLHIYLLPPSHRNRRQSLIHILVPHVDLVSHIESEIPITLLPRDMIDSSTQRILEPIGYLRTCILDVLVVMGLVLEVHVELGLLRGHAWKIIIRIILCRLKGTKDLVTKFNY